MILLLLLLFAGPANILSVHSPRFAAFFAASKFKFRTDNNNNKKSNSRGNSAVSSAQSESQSQFGALLIYFNSFFISFCPLQNELALIALPASSQTQLESTRLSSLPVPPLHFCTFSSTAT